MSEYDSTIYHPVEVDGNTVVVLRESGRGFVVDEVGRLSYDGHVLWLLSQDHERTVDAKELNSLKFVTDENKIKQCDGFDFFRLIDS